jgi:hypothetical protein
MEEKEEVGLVVEVVYKTRMTSQVLIQGGQD